jgi:hypothetical protein
LKKQFVKHMSGKKKVTPFEYVCALIVLERFQPDTVLSSVWARANCSIMAPQAHNTASRGGMMISGV